MNLHKCGVFFFLISLLGAQSVSSQQEIVKEIDYYLNGDKVTDKATLTELRGKTEQKINEPLNRYEIRKSIENIYSLGDYAHIAVESKRINSLLQSVKLNFLLKSKIRIKDIKIRGNRHVSSSKILSAIKSKQDGEYVKSVVQKDLERIEEVYRNRGYFKSVAKLTQAEIDENDKISLKFFVVEEPRASLRSIKFTGNLSIPDKILRDKMKIGKDTGYNYEILKSDIERLKKLYQDYGYLTIEIKKPKIRYDAKENTIEITIPINEGPEVIVNLLGEDINREKLKSQIALYRRNNYSRFTLEKSAAEIESFYKEKGHYSVKANYSVRKELPEKVIIRFEIDKGELLTIARISFEGNNQFTDRQLKEKMETEEGSFLGFLGLRWLFPRGFFDRAQFENDLRAIRVFYKQHGYPEVRIDYKKPIDIREGKMYIKVRIHEGPRTLINQVKLHGNEAFKSEEIIPRLSAKVGKPYNQELLAKDVAFLRSLYSEKGYIYANIFPESQKAENQKVGPERKVRKPGTGPEVSATSGTSQEADELGRQKDDEQRNKKTRKSERPQSQIRNRDDQRGMSGGDLEQSVRNRINLTYYINEGKQTKVGKLHFSGNKKTQDVVISREFRHLGIDTGEILNLKNLNQCQQRLYALGLFKKVRFDIPGQAKGKEVLDINVEVTERNPGTINVSGGYSPSEGIRGTFEVAYNNLEGRGMRAGTKLRLGTLGNLYEARLTEPYLFNTRTRFTVRAFQDNLEEQNNIRATGGTVSLAKSIGLYNNISWKYKYQDLRAKSQDLETTVSSISIGFNKDTRDHFLNPSHGSFSDIVFEYAGGLLSGKTSFAKLKTTNKYYTSIKDDLILALALRTGYEQGLRSYRKKEIIAFERFSAGGSTTVRGYSEKSLGPVDMFGNHRGDVMFIFNAELRFPLLRLSIYKWSMKFRGVTFFDSGNVWDKLRFSEIKDNPPKSSVGLGLRIDTPIGPFRVDYGYPVSQDSKGQLYIALGHAF